MVIYIIIKSVWFALILFIIRVFDSFNISLTYVKHFENVFSILFFHYIRDGGLFYAT